MKYRTLGSTGLSVSVVGLGTWQYGGEWGRDFSVEDVAAILGKARDLGINLLDTAECYGDHLSESLIGQAFARSGRRDDWVIATKFGHRFHSFMNRTDERNVEHVRQQLDDSLRALGTDHIDLYQFHSVRENEFFNQELWTLLDEAKRSGKIRHIGNSIAAALDPTAQALASRRRRRGLASRVQSARAAAGDRCLSHRSRARFGNSCSGSACQRISFRQI